MCGVMFCKTNFSSVFNGVERSDIGLVVWFCVWLVRLQNGDNIG